MEKDKQVIALLFGNNADISLDEKARVIGELNKIGSLTFAVNTNEEGWVAQCNELTGIIAGGTNPNPTDSEIENQIRDSIYAAFNVEVEKKKADKKSPYFFTYTNTSSPIETNK